MTDRIAWGPDSPGYPECPVPPGTDCTVWFRDGTRENSTEEGYDPAFWQGWEWGRSTFAPDYDIIAYCDHTGTEAAEAKTMRYMREIAQGLGYASVLEALEACPPNQPHTAAEPDQARELLQWARAYVDDCPASATPSPERVELLARIDAYLKGAA